jgi:uncharacterized protein YcbX
MTAAKKIGVLASIHRYPVKSMIGEELSATRIVAGGVQGDRAFALADPASGKIASAKNPSKWPDLFQFRAGFIQPLNGDNRLPPARIMFPDESSVLTEDENIDRLLSSRLGKPVRFLTGAPPTGMLEEYWPDIEGLAKRDVVTDEPMPAETFFDFGAIHLLTTATLDSLRTLHPEGRFETRRFRPNLVIETGPESGKFPENDWTEKILAIGGEVKIKVTGPCGRCVMTTLAQGDLPRDSGILKTAVQHNRAQVGAYASVIRGGFVRQGDPVLIEPIRASD